MDSVRFGRQLRALRRRRGWRQDDLARHASVSRSVVARAEQGHADRLGVATLEQLARPLGARVTCRLDWNGEGLDRLLDAGHAAIVERVIRLLKVNGWNAATEVSFSIAGERGSIDVLAWHPGSSVLLVVEVKSTVPDVQATLFTLDRKVRLAPRIASERGWIAQTASRLLAVGDDRTSRRRVAQHAAIFGNAFPGGTAASKRWIGDARAHTRPLAGLMFLTADRQAIARHRIAGNLELAKRGRSSDS